MHSRDLVKSQIYTYIFRKHLKSILFWIFRHLVDETGKTIIFGRKNADQRINDFRVGECPGFVNALGGNWRVIPPTLHPEDSEAGLQEDMVIGTPGWLDHKESRESQTRNHETAWTCTHGFVRPQSQFVQFLSRCDQVRFVWGTRWRVWMKLMSTRIQRTAGVFGELPVRWPSIQKLWGP